MNPSAGRSVGGGNWPEYSTLLPIKLFILHFSSLHLPQFICKFNKKICVFSYYSALLHRASWCCVLCDNSKTVWMEYTLTVRIKFELVTQAALNRAGLRKSHRIGHIRDTNFVTLFEYSNETDFWMIFVLFVANLHLFSVCNNIYQYIVMIARHTVTSTEIETTRISTLKGENIFSGDMRVCHNACFLFVFIH